MSQCYGNRKTLDASSKVFSFKTNNNFAIKKADRLPIAIAISPLNITSSSQKLFFFIKRPQSRSFEVSSTENFG